MQSKLVALLACVLAATVAGVRADGALSTAFYFPDHPMKQFPAGELVKVVVSAHNEGAKALNMTHIMGSLGSTENYALQFQNFTPIGYYEALAPGEELSMEYRFTTLPMLAQGAPREFQVTLNLFYLDAEGTPAVSTFFNQTIEIVEPARMVDTELILMVLTLLGIAGAIGYAVVSNYSDALGINKATKKRASKAAKAATFNEEEWVAGTQYDLSKRKKAGAKKVVAAGAEGDS